MHKIWSFTSGCPQNATLDWRHPHDSNRPEFLALLAALLCFVLAVLASISRNRRRRAATIAAEWQKLPPGPTGWPVLGNLLQLAGGLPHRTLVELAVRYGPILRLKLGRKLAVVVSSASTARNLLQEHERTFANRISMENHLPYGQHRSLILGPYGERWRHLRRLFKFQLFSASRVASFSPIRSHEVARLLYNLGQHAKSAELHAQPVNLTDCIGACLENIICRILVSKPLEDMICTSSGAISLQRLLKRGVELFKPAIGDFVPWLGFLDYKMRRCVRELHGQYDVLLEDLIQEREKETGPKVRQEDFLDVLMSPESALDRDGIKALLLEMLGAGIDTTHTVTDWAMAEILSNPQALNGLQEELDMVVGHERMVEEGDISKLPFLQATIKEALRLHAPVPLIPRGSTEPCQVGSFSLPCGTILMLNAWAIHRDAMAWEQPNKFMPERFLGNSQESSRDLLGQQYELLPFGFGRRICAGVPIALPTLQVVVSNLIHCFNWMLPAGANSIDRSEKFSSVLSRSQPLLLIPSPRFHLP